ncbi:serine hydrolase domain-containing protein [Engelhardtia mirabilis]|uniref:serine hydrolase domain-containing protein n=1 Tax=Engelhardtia mirabilis TaxID=2528011 RepID=UPI003AF3EAB7
MLDSLVSNEALPGISLGLALPDGSALGLAAGLADADSGEALTPEHLLLAGSAGKLFVTAAAQLLLARGQLDLDQRAADRLGDQTWFARVPNHDAITLRQLLRHQSGIPRYVFDPAFSAALVADPDHVWVAPERIAYVFDHEPLFEAGQGWAYADTNYLLVGLLIERAGGTGFYDYVEEELLRPLGLGGAPDGSSDGPPGIVPSNRRDLPHMAQGHVVMARDMVGADRSLKDGVFQVSPQFEWCGGGYATRPVDLALWTRSLMSGRAIDADYLPDLLDGVDSPPLGIGTRYGLGVILSDGDLGPVRGHSGFMPGYLTFTEYFAEFDLAVTVQINTDDGRGLGESGLDLCTRLASIVIEGLAADASAPGSDWPLQAAGSVPSPVPRAPRVLVPDAG